MPTKRESGDTAYAKAFLQFARALSADVSLVELRELIARHGGTSGHTGRAARVTLALSWLDVREGGAWAQFYNRLYVAYSKTLEASGQAALDKLPGRARFRVEKARTDVVVPVNPYSVKWIKAHAGEKIYQVRDQQRAAVRAIVANGYERGARPEAMAEQIKRTIGLTQRQALAVDRYQLSMSERLGDEERAQTLAERYAGQQLALRAETIARTETNAAQNQGQQDAWLVARDEGLLDAKQKRRWRAVHGERTCEECEEMDGQTVALDEPFYSEALDVELDCPPLHPDCRCIQTLASD
jgi:SPP1 gp7 family putative phage head morphogenesis protein